MSYNCKLMTICSLHKPPHYQLHKHEFQSFIDELLKPYLVLGDLNAHSSLWGDSSTDARGRLNENFLFSTGTRLLNNEETTFYSLTNNTYPSIDLSIISTSVFLDFNWEVVRNTYESDHFPTLFKTHRTNECPHRAPHWTLEKSNWEEFYKLAIISWADMASFNIDNSVEYVTAFLINAASQSIPEIAKVTRKRRVPWWNNECGGARKKQNKAWELLRDSPTAENLEAFKQAKSQGRGTRRGQARRKSCKKFLLTVNSYIDEGRAWNCVIRIRGQQAFSLPFVNVQGNTLEGQANSLGQYFELVSSTSHYSETFSRYKARVERQKLQRQSTADEPYNRPFCLAELQASLNCCNNSAPGSHCVMYEMLKHLPYERQKTLLGLYNTMWFSGEMPLA